jgi:uncharacterized protein
MFLQSEKGAAWISDFTLHSIGVLLFRQKRTALFDKFAADTLSHFTVLSLNKTGYSRLAEINKRLDLDFDDAYQYSVALESKLAIATQDKDFQRARASVDIHLL